MSGDKGICFFCNTQFGYRAAGFVINAAKQEFCGPICCHAHHRKMQRIRKGEATWKDILK